MAHGVRPRRLVGGLATPQLVFFAILTVAFVLLITERLRNDLVAVLIVVAGDDRRPRRSSRRWRSRWPRRSTTRPSRTW